MPWRYSKKTIISFCCAFVVLCGCGAERARLDTDTESWTDEIIVRGIE